MDEQNRTPRPRLHFEHLDRRRSAAVAKTAHARKRLSARGGNPAQSRSRRNRGHGR